MTESLLVPYYAVATLEAKAVLVLAPHADDEVFGCGGALAIHASVGCSVSVVVVSDGAYAAADEAEREQILAVREAESAAAAAILGYAVPQFWRLPDRGVEYGEALIERLLTAIAASSADLIYAPALSEAHPDHRALGMAAVEAARRLATNRPGLRLAMYEVGMPLHPNLLLDITAMAELKAEAMRCFSSQLAAQPYDAHIAALNRYRTYSLPKTVLAAEAFHLVDAAALERDPLQLFASEYAKQARLGLVVDADRDLPLVSVIIRSMDRQYLSAALDSLALQTYPHIEVVIVNAKGGTHRDLGGRCGRFPIRMINQHGVALGRAVAANKGLQAAHGACLMFLDDDDWLAADHLAKLVAGITADPARRVVHTGIACVNSAGEIGPVFDEPFDWLRQMSSNFLPIHAVLFSAELVAEGCQVDESLDLYEDWDFWLQVAERAEPVFISGVSGYYRIYPSSGVHQETQFVGPGFQMIYRKWLQRLSLSRWTRLMQAVWEATSRIREYHGNWQNTERRLLEVEQQRQDASLRANKAEQRLAELESQFSSIQQQVCFLNDKLAASQSELAAVYASSSWRLTAGLRKIKQALSKR